jgi:hypothetical protein
VLYPGDDSREWFISVAIRVSALGGYEIERHDPDTGHRSKTTATLPAGLHPAHRRPTGPLDVRPAARYR